MMPVSSGENVACTTIANSSTGAAFQAQMGMYPLATSIIEIDFSIESTYLLCN